MTNVSVKSEIQKNKDCKYCTGGKVNEYGEIQNQYFQTQNRTNVFHNPPMIFTTNGMSFLIVENFQPIKIHYCPMCGKDLCQIF